MFRSSQGLVRSIRFFDLFKRKRRRGHQKEKNQSRSSYGLKLLPSFSRMAWSCFLFSVNRKGSCAQWWEWTLLVPKIMSYWLLLKLEEEETCLPGKKSDSQTQKWLERWKVEQCFTHTCVLKSLWFTRSFTRWFRHSTWGWGLKS